MENVSVPVLYHTKWHPSSIILNVIKELDVPEEKFMVKTLTTDEMKTGDEFVKVSPRRLNPVLVLPDGSTVLETGAITMYVLERFDKDGSLHPLSWDERRPKFLQGMFYSMTDSFQKALDYFHATKMTEKRDEEKIAQLEKKIHSIIFDHLEKELKCGQSDYYLGSEYSAVDMMFAYIFMCLKYCEMEITSPVVKEYFERLEAKDAYKFIYTPTEDEIREDQAKMTAQNGNKNATTA